MAYVHAITATPFFVRPDKMPMCILSKDDHGQMAVSTVWPADAECSYFWSELTVSGKWFFLAIVGRLGKM
jgi:hypothetical protein